VPVERILFRSQGATDEQEGQLQFGANMTIFRGFTSANICKGVAKRQHISLTASCMSERAMPIGGEP
jgi:hypothetical protein